MKLLALDGNSIVNRAFYGVKALTTKNGDFTNAIFGFLMILRKMLDEVHPDYVAVAFDLPQPTFRHQLYDGYKSQRKGMPKELASQMAPLKALLKALGYQTVTCPEYEADDILGTLAATCRAQGAECVIATGDRDSLQLVGGGVSVRLASTLHGQPTTTQMDEAAILEKYGVTPAQLIDVKAFMGDASDNIPGVPGVGEKTALNLIAKYGSFDSVYENLQQHNAGLRKKLEENRELAELSRTLARIDCTAPIKTELSHYAIKPVKQADAAKIFAKLEMFKMQQKWGVAVDASSYAQLDLLAAPPSTEPLKICPQTDLMDFLETRCDCVFYRRENNQLAAALVRGDEVLFAEHEDAIAAIWLHASALRVWDSKAFYKQSLAANQAIPQVAFDGQLAAYLLNPLGKQYAMQDLAAQYGVLPRKIDGPIPCACIGIVEDAQVVCGLFDRLEQQIRSKELDRLLWDIELPLARVLAAMEWEGFTLDVPALEAYGLELEERLVLVQKSIYEQSGKPFNVNSPRQLGEVLFDQLGLPAKKKTKTGYSTDAEVLQDLRGLHPIVDLVLEFRQMAKLKSTYVDGLLAQVDQDGRVRTTFQQTETRTGRISSTEPNLQNIPIRTAQGSRLRQFFTARTDWKLVDADYSQIELRVLAHMAHDEAMQHAFREGQDIHTATAAQVFHMPLDMVTPQMRSRAKAVNFGIVYGIGGFSLAQDIGVSVAEADEYIKNYLDTYSGVRRYMENSISFAKENGYVKTMFGRRRHLPELVSAKRSMRSFGERIAMNMPIQGTAADIIKIAMIRVYERLEREQMKARLILQVHDELLVEAPEDEVEKATLILREEMENAISLEVPLTADTHVGHTWLEAK